MQQHTKRSVFKFMLSLLALCMILITGTKIQANNTATGPSFYISLVPTANNLVNANQYFSLKVGEKHQQTIQIVVHNESNKPLTIQQQILSAYTTPNGAIGYTPTDKPITFDKTLKYKLTDFVTLESPDKFTVKANSSATVSAKIDSTLPKDFNGLVLGSWHFVQYGGNAHKIQKGVTINNQYAYVTSIGLQKDSKVLPDLKLPAARAMISNGRPGVGLTFQNPKPSILSKGQMQMKIIRLKDDKEVLSQALNNIERAPNSNFEYFIQSGKSALAPGKYRAIVDATSGMQKWHLTKDFGVTAAQVTKINKETVIKTLLPWA